MAALQSSLRRRTLWVAVLLAAAAAAAGWRLGTRPAIRNVVLISIDTLRADHLGAYGYARTTSPNLDRLAARGTLFTQAVAQAPNTPPSQMSLVTSLYYSAHGFAGMGERLPQARVTLAELLKAQGFATWGFVDGGYLRGLFGFGQGFDHYEDTPRGIAAILDSVEGWLDRHRVTPFFIFLHCYDVHAPYAPPPPFRTMFEDASYTGDFEPTPENLNEVAMRRRPISPEDLQHAIARYDGGIAYTDAQLGRFFASLERRGLLDSTIVVVTSDHGEEFQEHGSMLHWQTYLYPNLHVPLFFFVPGRPARRIDGPVELVDVLPTVLDLLGLPPHPAAMGRSLVPLMADGTAPIERYAFAEPFILTNTTRTVVSDRHQLFYDTRTGRSLLFDIRDDPRATVNLAKREPEITQRLLAVLQDRLRRALDEKARDSGLATERTAIDEETRRQLRALGYIE